MENKKVSLIGDSIERTPASLIQEFERTVVESSDGVVYKPMTLDKAREQYNRSVAMRDNFNINAIPFIMPEIFPEFALVQGITLVCGQTGKGKSTTAANALYGYLKYNADPMRKAVVITTEESVSTIIDRVSCMQLGYNYNDLHNNKLPRSIKDVVKNRSFDLLAFIELVDEENYNMTCLEHVKAVLEYASKGHVGLVVLDYYQTVTDSQRDSKLNEYQVYKELGFYLKEYGRKHGVPILVFAQIRDQTRPYEPIQFRIQGDRTIANHSYNIIEVIPDFNALTTEFKIHKNRFGNWSGKSSTVKFNRGRYEVLGG